MLKIISTMMRTPPSPMSFITTSWPHSWPTVFLIWILTLILLCVIWYLPWYHMLLSLMFLTLIRRRWVRSADTLLIPGMKATCKCVCPEKRFYYSDLFPHNLLSVSSLDEENCADTTPESLHSLERIPLVFPNRHLLSNFSPERLDRNFSESPEQSHRFSSTPSGEKHLGNEYIND